MANRTIKITTTPRSDGVIEQVEDWMGEIRRSVINTREAQVRDALIALGWTPPPDEKA